MGRSSGTIVAVEAVPVAVTGIRPFRISEGQASTHYSVVLRLLTETPGGRPALRAAGQTVTIPAR